MFYLALYILAYLFFRMCYLRAVLTACFCSGLVAMGVEMRSLGFFDRDIITECLLRPRKQLVIRYVHLLWLPLKRDAEYPHRRSARGPNHETGHPLQDTSAIPAVWLF